MAGGNTGKGGARRGERVPAADLPVARVAVDVSLPHLDRPFDYLVPERLDSDAVPGCRVRVRFAGQLVDGFLLDRVAESDYSGKLAFLEKVVSAEPVLSADIAHLARAVADRYGGTLADVLRLAIPPRHATAERQASADPGPPPANADPAAWHRYPRGTSFLDAVHAGKPAHAVWHPLPLEDWPTRLAEAAAAAASAGRGALLVVPDHRDLARVHAACGAQLGADQVVALSADLGPAERYRRWLAVRRGAVRIVVGTRAAMFAPIDDPGLFVVWDDGDDLHVEPRAPYPQVRDVSIQRAHLAGAALLIGGFARTAEAQVLVDTGWAHQILADRNTLRATAPRVTAIGESDDQLARDPTARAARLPSVAFEAARAALAANAPVLVQVPRRGYVPALACQTCRTPARCRTCAGPLALPADTERGGAAAPRCRWCGVTESAFRCAACGSRRLRATVIGARRTAEELGRAFSGVPVRTSGGAEVLAEVSTGPAIVVCTPGAEPMVAGGYGAALLLDGWALLSRADLRATEEALRRWMAAAALVRSGPDGGRVVVMADSSLAPVQALVRWDPVWHATRELAARAELGFPPATRMAAVDGSATAVADFLLSLRLPTDAGVLGPVPLEHTGPGEPREERERVLVRTPRVQGRALAAALAAALSVRTARKEPDPVRVRLDPLELV